MLSLFFPSTDSTVEIYGSGCDRNSLMPRILGQIIPEQSPSAVKPRADRADRTVDEFGDFLIGKVFQIAQDHHCLEIGGEFVKSQGDLVGEELAEDFTLHIVSILPGGTD